MLLINLVIGFFNAIKINSLECMSMINQKCMSRPKIINVNKNEPVFYPHSIRVNKFLKVVMTLMILLQNYAFLIVLKILMLKCFI